MCHRPRIYHKNVKESVRQAKLLCAGYEDTLECKNAWQRVRVLEEMYENQCRVDEMIRQEMLNLKTSDSEETR
jgi:hypothetical protein